MLDLLGQAIQRTVERGGLYWDIRTGISRGCPLSPLLGALYLKVLDQRLSGTEAYYLGYIDDIPVLTKTRWQLRRAVLSGCCETFSSANVWFSVCTTYGSLSERSGITRHGFIGFMSCRKRRLMAYSVCKSLQTE